MGYKKMARRSPTRKTWVTSFSRQTHLSCLRSRNNRSASLHHEGQQPRLRERATFFKIIAWQGLSALSDAQEVPFTPAVETVERPYQTNHPLEARAEGMTLSSGDTPSSAPLLIQAEYSGTMHKSQEPLLLSQRPVVARRVQDGIVLTLLRPSSPQNARAWHWAKGGIGAAPRDEQGEQPRVSIRRKPVVIGRSAS